MQCKWCDNDAHIKQGRIWLCKKHYRFQQMRVCAKRHGKTVPEYDELEKIHQTSGGICPSCKRDFNWLSKEGAETVISLQHDRSGKHAFLCRSCNSRHDDFEGDSFYKNADSQKKKCPRCLEWKQYVWYCTDNSSRWKKKKTYCRTCSAIYHKEWLDKNKEKQNEWRRKYYHARKESGNPIPR